MIGAGCFAAFASKAFVQLPGVSIAAVSDVNEQAGKQLANKQKAIFYPVYHQLLGDPKIHLVYIATPPFLHFEISKNALLAGKHVICEKPAALNSSEAEELRMLANKLKLLYVVNLMQRYNGLYAVVKKIIDKKIMGSFLHGYFENYASDESLDNDHWFWDETKSGGIFIEHAVHFFDMFTGWLGPGTVINSFQLRRTNVSSSVNDRVQATVLYDAATVNFYHGFNQPKILDRQEMKLEFDRGDITLYGWIPVKIKLHGLYKKAQLKELAALIKPFTIQKHKDKGQKKNKAKGKYTERSLYAHITIKSKASMAKKPCYRQMLTDMLDDQWAWIKDNSHTRLIDDNNAIDSLRTAEHAKNTAQKF